MSDRPNPRTAIDLLGEALAYVVAEDHRRHKYRRFKYNPANVLGIDLPCTTCELMVDISEHLHTAWKQERTRPA